MPQVTVYIREDDLPKWKSIEKKSEFIHNAIHQEVHPLIMHVPTDAELEAELSIGNPPKERASNVWKGPTSQAKKLCKIHLIPLDSRGKCLQKGCKYS